MPQKGADLTPKKKQDQPFEHSSSKDKVAEAEAAPSKKSTGVDACEKV